MPKITKAEYGRLHGIRRATVGKACKKGGLLAAACSGKDRGVRIDTDHPAAIAYASRWAGKAPRSEDPQGTGKRGGNKGAGAERDRRAWEARAQEETLARAGDAAAQAFADATGVAAPPRQARGRAPADAVAPAPVSVVEAMAVDLPEHLRALLDWRLRDIVNRYGNIPHFEAILKATKTIADIEEKQTKTAQRRGELVDREFIRTHVLGVVDGTLRRLLDEAPSTLAVRALALAKTGGTEGELEDAFRKILTAQLRDMKTSAVRGLRKSGKHTMEVVSDEPA